MPKHSDKPTQVRWVIFVLACAASWVLYLHRYSWGVIKPYFRAENPEISDIEIGWLDSAFQGTYALGQVPGGLVGDIFGPRAILGSSILLWTGAAVAVAWVSGFWIPLLLRSTFGVTQAAAYPILSKVTRNWFPLSVRTSVQGFVAAMGRIGAASCPVILATVLMGYWSLSWQTALLILAVPGFFLAIAFWIFVRDNPQDHPLVNDAERARIAEGSVPTSTQQPIKVQLRGGSGVSLVLLMVYAFASTFQDQLYVYWIPTFLVEGHGMGSTQMGMFAPLPLIGGAMGGILGGYLNDTFIRRTGNRRWSRAGVAFTGKFIQAGFVLWSVQIGNGFIAMGVLATARIFGDWSLSTQWGAITDMGGRASATLFGLVNTVGAFGGFVAGPCLGWLKQHYGWEGLFAGAAAMCLIAAFTWLFIDCTKRVVD